MDNMELRHHGIIGQKWGKRNGPPYPLDTSDMSKAERAANKASKYVKTINKKTERDNESKNRKPFRSAIGEAANDTIARKIKRSYDRSDQRWADAGRSDKVRNLSETEARGLANIREGGARRSLAGQYLGGIAGNLIGSSRWIKSEKYIKSLDRDEQEHLLSVAAGFKDPGRALAVVDAYRKIDSAAKNMTPAERDHYFDIIKKQLND